MEQTKIIGLLGYPLAHSKSPELFQSFFDAEKQTPWHYEKFEYADISSFLNHIKKRPEIVGFNVTVPHKIKILPFLDEIDPKALRIGAVNTVLVQRVGSSLQLKGYNTDYYGFLENFKELNASFQQALILGTGGASKSVAAVLEDLHIPYTRVSRSQENGSSISYAEIQHYLSLPKTLVVNTTPVGMAGFPIQNLPFSLKQHAHDLTLIDLIYNPHITPLMHVFLEKDLTCLNGWIMLKKQAEKAWYYFKNSV
jgi:shikimate dehydrogenase